MMDLLARVITVIDLDDGRSRSLRTTDREAAIPLSICVNLRPSAVEFVFLFGCFEPFFGPDRRPRACPP
jgi:hypothetical protein